MNVYLAKLMAGGLGLFVGASSPCWCQDASPLRDRIGKLIEQLGDSSYGRRQNAKMELERIGVVALDQLHAASFHVDPQIAAAARFIVQSNQFNWDWEYDSPRVREILSNYGSAEIGEKTTYIDELARLEREDGLPALCRLARYETYGALAKRAALHVLQSKPPIGQPPESRAKRILSYLDGGESTASQWIQKHFANETITTDMEWWKKEIDKESQLINSRSSDSSYDIKQDLTKWIVFQICRLPSMREQAIELGKSLLEPRPTSLNAQSQMGAASSQAEEFAQWALRLELSELVQIQHASLSYRVLSREPIFTYYLAESYLQLGNLKLADAIAENALNQRTVDVLGAPMEPPAPNNDPLNKSLEFTLGFRNSSSTERRYYIGSVLANRGRFDWAERELAIAADQDLLMETSLRCLQQLAEIQHSLGRFEDAKKTLEPFVLRFENEPMFRRQMMDQSESTAFVRSYYHLYAADALRTSNEAEAASHYIQSIEILPANVDAIIGLYKLKETEELQSLRREKLKHSVTELRTEIRRYDEFLKKYNSEFVESFFDRLANNLNSLAWLIANTEGDFGEAVLLSRRACLLDPDHAEYLDTLAHCYFAAGKWKDAVEQQRKACELKPHHPDLKRALSRFEEKLATSQKQ